MKRHRRKHVLILSVLLATLIAVPALAGKITFRNLHRYVSYSARNELWLLGIKGHGSKRLDPGKTEWYSNPIVSIGKIEVWAEGGNIRWEYSPSGGYWPWREFTVIIQEDGDIQISEN